MHVLTFSGNDYGTTIIPRQQKKYNFANTVWFVCVCKAQCLDITAPKQSKLNPSFEAGLTLTLLV